MLEPTRTAALFADARLLYDEAIELLDLGKLRIAAEVAWGATKRATDALILARTGREPSVSSHTSSGLRNLIRSDPTITSLLRRYNRGMRYLHVQCFYWGHCGSEDERVRDIRTTIDYIRDAERLAGL